MQFTMELSRLNRSWLMFAGMVVVVVVATHLSRVVPADHMAHLDAAALLPLPGSQETVSRLLWGAVRNFYSSLSPLISLR